MLTYYSRVSNNRTVWNKRTGETNSQKLINAQDEITAQGKLLDIQGRRKV